MRHKNFLARKLAKGAKTTQANAADQLDELVHNILKKLDEGRDAELPGVGILRQSNQSGPTLKRDRD